MKRGFKHLKYLAFVQASRHAEQKSQQQESTMAVRRRLQRNLNAKIPDITFFFSSLFYCRAEHRRVACRQTSPTDPVGRARSRRVSHNDGTKD